MKIAIFDTENGRFSHYMRDHWRDLGHEVVARGGYDPTLADWADIIYIEWTDMNIQLAAKGEWLDDNRNRIPRPILNRKDKKIVNRMIDIDMWAGHGAGVEWSGVDDLIFIAPHIQRLANQRFAQAGIGNVRQHLIRPGVNLDTWTFRPQRADRVKNIAFIGELWENKGVDRAIRILIELTKQYGTNFRLHFRGTFPNANYFYHYNQHLLDTTGIRELVTFYPDIVTDLNDWLSDKDYLLNASIKEAFSYVTAEAMAKGIKPVIHRFFGSEEIWPEKYIWTTEMDAVRALASDDYHPEEYRKYIEENYDERRMLSEIDEVCGIK